MKVVVVPGTWEVERWVCNKWEMGSKDADGIRLPMTPRGAR